MNIYRMNGTKRIVIPLTDREMEQAYEIMKYQAFADDFVERYIDRCDQEIGRCNLPVDTLENETELLETAYKLYQELQDCNCTFNDTLNTIFNKIELMVQQNAIALQAA